MLFYTVGYRVKSRRGIEFHRWANSVLKEHLLARSGNRVPIALFGNIVNILKRVSDSLDAKQVLSVIEQFTILNSSSDDN